MHLFIEDHNDFHDLDITFEDAERPHPPSIENGYLLDLGQQRTYMSPKARPSLGMKRSWIRPHK